MKSLIKNFPAQLEEALNIGSSAKLNKAKTPIKNVVISGMGGSGIAGTIVSEIFLQESKIPITVTKNYSIPAYVNKNTLVIVSSYSGNTEETIEAMGQALRKKATVVCIASGGKIINLAKKKGIDHIIIPSGMPPRACIGYSMVQILFVLNHFKLIPNTFKKDIEASVNLLKRESKSIEKEAKKVAKALFGKIPVIYSPAGFEGIAVRFRQNINENSKMMAWHHVIPEMNHNEILGWAEENKNLAVIFFRNDTDDKKVQKRIEITKKIISKQPGSIIDIYSKGKSLIEKTIYHIHLGDLISVILAEMKGIDAKEVRVIEYLKKELKR